LKINIKILENLDSKIDWITSIIVIYSLSLMLLLVFSQIVFRDLFRFSMYGIEELARYLLVAFSFFGASIALRKNELVGVTFARNALPIKTQRWVDLAGIFLVSIFLMIITIYGFRLVVSLLKTGQLSPSLRIPMSIVYSVVPLGFLLMLFRSLLNAFDLFFCCSLKKNAKYKQITEESKKI